MKSLFKRLGSDVAKGMPVFVASYIKRMLEGKYDYLINETIWGQRLKKMGLSGKFSTEGLLYILNAIASSELPEDSFFKRVVKEVLLDAGPEISKRIINGDKISEKIGEEAKSKIGRLIELGKIEKPKERELASLMLELDNETLAGLLAWTYGIEEEERKRTVGLIKNLSPEELAKFAGLSKEGREQMVELLTEKPPKEKPKSQIGEKIIEGVKETLRDATSSMKKLIRNSVITTLALSGISILFALFGIYWPLKLSVFIIGLIFIALLVAAFPILTLASVAHEKVPAIKHVVQLYAAIVFWIFQMMIYFSIVPIQNAPAAIPLVLLLFAAIAFGFVAYGFKVGINPKWAMIRTGAILCLVTFFFFFPQTHEYINLGAEKISEEITIWLKAPRVIEYRSDLAFFNTVTGKPKVWFYKRGDSRFDLFDGPGFHPITREKLQPVTPETVIQILEWQKSRWRIPEPRLKEPRPVVPGSLGSGGSKPLELKPGRPVSEEKGQISPAPLPRITRTSHFDLNPDERNTWRFFRAGGDADIEIFADGVICWDSSHPEGCVAADGASWIPMAINAAELNKYPVPNERFLCLLGRINNGPVFKIGVRKKLEIKKDDQLSFLLNMPSDSNIYLWQGLSLEIKETEK